MVSDSPVGEYPAPAVPGRVGGSDAAAGTALILQHIFAATGPVPRTALAEATGLPAEGLSASVGGLLAAQVVVETDAGLAPARGTLVGLGLEFNLSHVSARLVDLAGRVLYEHHLAGEFGHTDPTTGLETVARAARRALDAVPEGARLASLNLALPGLVNNERGMLLRAPNLEWRNVPVRETLLDAGLPEVRRGLDIANVADYGATAVLYAAPGRTGTLTSFLYVAGDAGIGASPVIRGQVLEGAHGWSGEIGHMCIDPDGPLCGCGAMGCLESIAGPRALLRHTGIDDWAVLLASLEQPRVREVLRRAGRALGIGFANALNLLDLSVVVIGGRLADVVHVAIPTIERELRRRVLSAPYEDPRVLTPDLGTFPSSLGAAYAGLNAVLRNPARLLGIR